MIHKIIFNIGAYFRNPSYKRILSELEESKYLSSEQLRNIQKSRLNKILSHAVKYSDFYKKCYDGIDVESINLDNLNTLPILDKKTLLEKNKQIHTTDVVKFKKLFFCETSGSSGEPLTFYRNEEWDSYNRASISRGLKQFNVEPYDKNGYFWGYIFSEKQKIKMRFFDFLLNRFRVFKYDDESLNVFLDKLKTATYLHGYSSMIYETAKVMNKKGLKNRNLKLIKGTSEKIYDIYHKETLKAFGLPIISEYGAAETGIIAFECPHGNMHINEETCIVEVINNEAIITNLVSLSFPIIRYRLGDYVELSDKICSCGRKHKIIKEVTGRIGKNIIGIHNSYPSLTLYYVFKYLAIEHAIQINYKAIQKKKGYLDINVDRILNNNERELLIESLVKYFNDDIEVIVNEDMILHDKNGKLKDFESFL